MNSGHRRNQADVLEELFCEETTGCTPEEKVLWLLGLFRVHLRRLDGVTKALERPLDRTFFDSDFLDNLLLVDSLVQRELWATKDSQAIDRLWKEIATRLDSTVNNKSERGLNELPGVFEETMEKMSAFLE